MAELNPLFADIAEDFAKDASKENDGVWMPYKRFEYRVARAHRDNTAFAKMMEERMRPYQWALNRGDMAALKDVANDVLQEVYAETVLKGIRRVGTKEELAYSPKDGVALFTKLPDLWDNIFKFAQSDEPYSPDAVKDDSKN
jgi:hypothetical protein